jgi:hypothetical protein
LNSPAKLCSPVLSLYQATHVRVGSAVTRDVMRRSQYTCISVVHIFDAGRPNAVCGVSSRNPSTLDGEFSRGTHQPWDKFNVSTIRSIMALIGALHQQMRFRVFIRLTTCIPYRPTRTYVYMF